MSSLSGSSCKEAPHNQPWRKSKLRASQFEGSHLDFCMGETGNPATPEGRFLRKAGQSPVQSLHQLWSLDVPFRPPAGRGHRVRFPVPSPV